ncbi:hypothetical protein O6H91_22G058300 [Diphasiastrum complanatum]|uniref:Uncharacterized protein n=1 Tax=Diphasiastrum complanatum TaxID=34168 RepID=A0ACC2AFV8_DIPCM|nr:hypothetical protein O6H91_22G058300 [Diphasiastrum complanatum]
MKYPQWRPTGISKSEQMYINHIMFSIYNSCFDQFCLERIYWHKASCAMASILVSAGKIEMDFVLQPNSRLQNFFRVASTFFQDLPLLGPMLDNCLEEPIALVQQTRGFLFSNPTNVFFEIVTSHNIEVEHCIGQKSGIIKVELN